MTATAERTAVPSRKQSTDSALCQDIERAFCASGFLPLRDVKIYSHERVVTLEGCVPTYYLKQMAQAIALKDRPIEILRNNIEVASG